MRLKEPVLRAAQDADEQEFFRRLTQFFRDVSNQLNGITEGRVSVFHAAYTAAPTDGQFVQGDFVLNSTPSELGTAGNKYIIHGWRCTASGTPGTWLQIRTLTGN